VQQTWLLLQPLLPRQPSRRLGSRRRSRQTRWHLLLLQLLRLVTLVWVGMVRLVVCMQ
jgi:hypothetical protein